MFGSDITDKLKLPTPCSCAGNIVRPSYDTRIRVQRNCIASATAGYKLSSICINNVSATPGYTVGTYLQIGYGTPSLLAYVSAVSGSKIAGITIINRPVFTGVPSGWLPATTLSGAGAGAQFYISVTGSTCCDCNANQTAVTCSGANYVNITNIQYST